MVVTTTIKRPLGRYPIAPYRAGGMGVPLTLPPQGPPQALLL